MSIRYTATGGMTLMRCTSKIITTGGMTIQKIPNMLYCLLAVIDIISMVKVNYLTDFFRLQEIGKLKEVQQILIVKFRLAQLPMIDINHSLSQINMIVSLVFFLFKFYSIHWNHSYSCRPICCLNF